ncbi:MAG: serine/threonine protein kinase [Gammaproteobacteria bacterium]|nr:serine/threonine protein kinase [Gammaproteobacteria bacterium]
MTNMKIPDYTIIREIGKGGMAAVYLAIQESLDRPVALKVMQPSFTSESGNFTERFLKEGRIIAQFQHPKIITIYDFGSHDPYHYFSMEFLSKGTLSQRIAQGLSPEHALEIVKSIAEALAYAHGLGIVHRDIKPQNILFRQDDTPVLSDFGIAKVIDAEDTRLTIPGLIIGSPTYMSPEQITGKDLDNRSDLYSLGVVLYEMLSKEPPYRSSDVLSIAMMHCTQPVPQLPISFGKLQPMLQRLLAKDPAERFESAEEFIDVLDHTQTQPLFFSFSETADNTVQIIPTIKKSLRFKNMILAGGLAFCMVAIGITVLFRQRASTTHHEQTALQDQTQQQVAQLLERVHALQRQGNWDASLQQIETGLTLAPNQTEFLQMRKQAQAAIATQSHIVQLLQDCAARFSMKHLTAQEGNAAAACYRSIIVLASDNYEAHAQLEQLADRYADWAKTAIEQANFQFAEECLKQLSQPRPNHPQFVNLNQSLQAKREQASNEAKLNIEKASQQAADDAKRQATLKLHPEKASINSYTHPKTPSYSVSKPEVTQSSRPFKPVSKLAGQPRPKRAKSICREALLKAQLGEPLSIVEQESCKP